MEICSNNLKILTLTKAPIIKPKWTIALGIPLLIFLACFFITLSAKFKTDSALLSNAILIDLLVVAPLVYFFAIRKSKVSKLSVSRIFIAGLLVAGFILNSHENTFLSNIKIWVSPIIEGVVIFFIVQKFYFACKKAKATNGSQLDFLMHCRAVMFQMTGNEKAGNIISSEIAVLYYALLGRKSKTIDNQTTFTGYKESGIISVLWVFLFIFLIETTGVHILLSEWNRTFAWIITVLSFYTCIQLFAHIRALKARPILINTNSLEIHNGLAGDAFIQFDNIEKFELSKKMPVGRNSFKIALIKGFENHNVVLYLKNPIEATKIFGIKKSTNTVLFHVDKAKDFENALTSKLNKGEDFNHN